MWTVEAESERWKRHVHKLWYCCLCGASARARHCVPVQRFPTLYSKTDSKSEPIWEKHTRTAHEWSTVRRATMTCVRMNGWLDASNCWKMFYCYLNTHTCAAAELVQEVGAREKEREREEEKANFTFIAKIRTLHSGLIFQDINENL